jgi:hypothetical protein
VTTRFALAAVLCALALPVQAQPCRLSVGQPTLTLAENQASLDCTVSGELDSVVVRVPGRICNADLAAQRNALAGGVAAWLRSELIVSGSLKARADRIRGLLQGNPDSEVLLQRLLAAANLSAKGLAANDEMSLTQVFASREPVRVAAGDCYSRSAMLAYAESLRPALQSFLATLEAFWIKAPCDSSQALLPASQSQRFMYGNTTLFDAVSPANVLHYPSTNQYQADICAAPGAASYQWGLAFGTDSAFEIVGQANAARVTVRAREGSVRGVRQAGGRLPDLNLSLNALFDANLPGAAGQRSQTGAYMLTKYGMVDAPAYPQVTRYWIEDYRLGTGSGTIENVGVVDPRLMLQAADTDGVVYIEGRNFSDSARFRLQSGAEMQVLERSTLAGGLKRVKAKTGEFRSGWISIAPSTEDSMWLPVTSRPVKRLAPFYLPRDLVLETIGAIEVGVGSPAIGKLTTRIGSKSGESTLAQIESSGVRLNVEDLRSQPYALTIADGPGQNQVTLKVELPFESEGDELVGTYEPTALYWVCESFKLDKSRCSDGGLGCLMDAVGLSFSSLSSCTQRRNWSEVRQGISGGEASRKPLRGQIDGFKLTLEIKLGVGGDVIKLDGYSVTSGGTYSISTSGTDLPRPHAELQEMIRTEVGNLMTRSDALKEGLQAVIDQLNTRLAGPFRIVAMKASPNVIFFDRESTQP